MKKIIVSLVVLLALLGFSACSATEQSEAAAVTPYEFTSQEEKVLQMFGIDSSAALVNFDAPSDSAALQVNVYYLTNGAWQRYGGGTVSLGMENEQVNQLQGMVSVLRQDEYALAIRINNGGSTATYNTDPLNSNMEGSTSAWTVLDSSKDIVLDQEIPVALYVYDDSYSMSGYTVDDYFTPEVFADMDLVQAVTLTFSAENIY